MESIKRIIKAFELKFATEGVQILLCSNKEGTAGLFGNKSTKYWIQFVDIEVYGEKYSTTLKDVKYSSTVVSTSNRKAELIKQIQAQQSALIVLVQLQNAQKQKENEKAERNSWVTV